MLGKLGWPELLVLLCLALLIFGPRRLGEFGTAIGQAIRGLRMPMKD
jgi:TatA/E family protein of Tat protein translocase